MKENFLIPIKFFIFVRFKFFPSFWHREIDLEGLSIRKSFLIAFFVEHAILSVRASVRPSVSFAIIG